MKSGSFPHCLILFSVLYRALLVYCVIGKHMCMHRIRGAAAGKEGKPMFQIALEDAVQPDELSTTLTVVLILFVTLVVGLLHRVLYKRVSAKHLFWYFLNSIIQVLIYVVGFIVAVARVPQLSRLTTTLLAGSGIVALAVSLSAQESLSNIVSGLFISLYRPFKVGDRIKLVNSGVVGYVESITLRHTVIKTLTNTRITVPNSVLNKEIIENSNLVETIASYYVDVSISYESDIDKARRIMADIVGGHPLYVDVRKSKSEEKVPVLMRAFESSGVALRARVWTKTVDDNFKACSDIRIELLRQFRKAGIEIPYTKIKLVEEQKDDHLP